MSLGESFERESEAKATPICPHCGGPMERAVAFVCAPGSGSGRLALPPHCPSKACQEARDDAAIADLVARGVIDP